MCYFATYLQPICSLFKCLHLVRVSVLLFGFWGYLYHYYSIVLSVQTAPICGRLATVFEMMNSLSQGW